MKNNGLSKPVYTDSRGEIRRYEVQGVEFNVLYTKAGVFRSGDYHPNTQYDIILKGKFKVTTLEKTKDVVREYGPNELIIILPNIPHLFESLTDTVMIEWWDGPFEAEYYKPYRTLVDEQLKKQKNLTKKT